MKEHSLSHFPDRVATGQCGFVLITRQKGESNNCKSEWSRSRGGVSIVVRVCIVFFHVEKSREFSGWWELQWNVSVNAFLYSSVSLRSCCRPNGGWRTLLTWPSADLFACPMVRQAVLVWGWGISPPSSLVGQRASGGRKFRIVTGLHWHWNVFFEPYWFSNDKIIDEQVISTTLNQYIKIVLLRACQKRFIKSVR